MNLIDAFIEAASAPRHAHRSGTLEAAETILTNHPHIAARSIYVAALLGDETAVLGFLAQDPASATVKGGLRFWDPLTYLCFSRFLRMDPTRSDAFVATARALLDAGASANTGWIELIDFPNPRPVPETAIYGAAGVAHHPALTRLLLERGADPNDEETPYHVPETHDNTVLRILLVSGKLSPKSISTLLLRKCDWHDAEGVQLILEHGADPNSIMGWGKAALHQAVQRDNSLTILNLLLDHGADPALPDNQGRTAIAIAARRGRATALDLFERRGAKLEMTGVDALLAACARDRKGAIAVIAPAEPEATALVIEHGGPILAAFAGIGNAAGVRNLLDLGVSPSAIFHQGDGYFGIARESTALHVAAWRGWSDVVKELIARGAAVNDLDGEGRSPLQLAVKACIDSYWVDRRTPHSVRALLDAGASKDGIILPTGYGEIDRLLA
jgi:ankyrin repeat protein